MLNRCPECQGFVPAASTACPNCRPAAFSNPGARSLGRRVAVAVGIVAMPVTLMACYGAPTGDVDTTTCATVDAGDGGTVLVCTAVDAGVGLQDAGTRSDAAVSTSGDAGSPGDGG